MLIRGKFTYKMFCYPDHPVPEPMSGAFMRCLCREMGPRFDLAADLAVSRPEVHTIMADPLLTSDEDKMFKVGQSDANVIMISSVSIFAPTVFVTLTENLAVGRR